MSTISKGRRRPTIATLAMFYDNQAPAEGGDELVIPEDLAALSDDDLADLTTRASEAFDSLYGDDGSGLSDDEFAALAALREGIIALSAETSARQTAAAERQAQAAAFAAEVRGEAPAEEPAEGGDNDEPADEPAEETPEEPAAEEPSEEPAAVVASGAARREIRLSSVSRRKVAPRQRTVGEAPSIRDVLVASGEGLGVGVGEGLDLSQAGAALQERLKGFSESRFQQAAISGRRVTEQRPFIQLRREIPEDLQVTQPTDLDHVREVFDRAGDETRLPNGSLVAAGGWCAPSQVLYDLVDEGASRDGLLSLPEVGAPRGGLSFTKGVDFADLFAAIQARELGFSFTEEDDVAGRYEWDGDENVVGPKPCYKVECPPFEEYRLDVDGLCLTAGLLQSRGYPEVLADTLRKTLIAHEHYLNGKMIAQMAAGSDAVTMPATQVGTTAPVLTAIELQVESYRYARRLARTVTLEAVFPYWVRGAIRSDLSRRLGVDLIDVPDARIDGWFRARGISPQFVYNWQAISGTASAVTSWPTTVSFLLYRAGTWIRGAADIITVDTLYDSVLLGNNDFTALFTEEGWFVAKRGQDSRLVTTSITADGAAHIGVDIAHNGTLVAAPVVPGATEDAPLFTQEVAA